MLHLAMVLPSGTPAGSMVTPDVDAGDHGSHGATHAMLATCVVLGAALGSYAIGRRSPVIRRPRRVPAAVRLAPMFDRGAGPPRARGPSRVEAGVVLRT